MSSHCQICGRRIKARDGRIAHHGYERPSYGFQTRSCIGAREKPYEVSCDAIPPAIQHIERWRLQTQALLDRFISNPPSSLTITSNGGHTLHHIERPQPFDPEQFDFRRLSYPREYRAQRDKLKREISAASEQIADLQQRLKDWKGSNEADEG